MDEKISLSFHITVVAILLTYFLVSSVAMATTRSSGDRLANHASFCSSCSLLLLSKFFRDVRHLFVILVNDRRNGLMEATSWQWSERHSSLGGVNGVATTRESSSPPPSCLESCEPLRLLVSILLLFPTSATTTARVEEEEEEEACLRCSSLANSCLVFSSFSSKACSLSIGGVRWCARQWCCSGESSKKGFWDPITDTW